MRYSSRKAAASLPLAVLIALSPLYPASAAQSSLSVYEATSLEPGEFVWEPERATDGEVEVVVSLPLQMVYVYRGGTLIGASTTSTGRAGHDTPTGSFNILQKRRDHRSNLYDDAPMPFMQRLTWDGIALHGGRIPGYPASHGCIRLPERFARHLFEVTELGAAVHVVDMAPDSPEMALAMARGDQPYTGMGGPDPELESAY